MDADDVVKNAVRDTQQVKRERSRWVRRVGGGRSEKPQKNMLGISNMIAEETLEVPRAPLAILAKAPASPRETTREGDGAVYVTSQHVVAPSDEVECATGTVIRSASFWAGDSFVQQSVSGVASGSEVTEVQQHLGTLLSPVIRQLYTACPGVGTRRTATSNVASVLSGRRIVESGMTLPIGLQDYTPETEELHDRPEGPAPCCQEAVARRVAREILTRCRGSLGHH